MLCDDIFSKCADEVTVPSVERLWSGQKLSEYFFQTYVTKSAINLGSDNELEKLATKSQAKFIYSHHVLLLRFIFLSRSRFCLQIVNLFQIFIVVFALWAFFIGSCGIAYKIDTPCLLLVLSASMMALQGQINRCWNLRAIIGEVQ